MSKPKIYAFNNGGSPGWYHGIGLAEDGTCLAQHICSDEYFIPHDLGVTSVWKHEYYEKHYPFGFEVVYVRPDAVKTHEGLQAALVLNRAQAVAAGEAEPE